MAYIGILLSRCRKKTHVVSEVLGLKNEKNLAKANKNITVCQGKPLGCIYYKDCGAD